MQAQDHSRTTLLRASLWTTAPLNLVAAFALAFPQSLPGALIGLPQQTYSLYTLLTGALVGLFGLVYAWMALQAEINRPLLLVGASGKLCAVTIAALLYVDGKLSALTAALFGGDLIFAGFWLIWIFHTRSDR